MPVKFFSISNKANKNAQKLPLGIHNKINKAFDIIHKNPLSGKKLKGELAGYYKYRVGDYRIIYTFDVEKSSVIILKVEHRQGAYK